MQALTEKSNTTTTGPRLLYRAIRAHSMGASYRPARAMHVEVTPEEKSPVNLRIRTSLKNKAKSIGVNLSQTLEQSLEAEISRREQLDWLAANRRAIEAYNRRIDERGPSLAAYRSF